MSPTHCPFGHKYDESNTRLVNGYATCRACNSIGRAVLRGNRPSRPGRAGATLCIRLSGEAEVLVWDSPEQAHQAARELMTMQSCGHRCALIHAVVTRDGDTIKSVSYPAEAPFAFWPGTPDRYVDKGLRLRVGTPPRPRYARTREEAFRLAYPRTVWGGLMDPQWWPAPRLLNPPLRPPAGPPLVPPSSPYSDEITTAGMAATAR